MRWALAVVAIAAACSGKGSGSGGAKAKNTDTSGKDAPPSKRVVPPTVDVDLEPLHGEFLIDDGTAIYQARELDPLTGGQMTYGAIVPAKAQALQPADLEKWTTDSSTPPSPVVMAPSTPATRVGQVADAINTSGRCFDPILIRHGVAGVLFRACPDAVTHDPYDTPVILTVNVQRDSYYLGISRYYQNDTVPNGAHGHDLDAFSAKLRQYKDGGYFGTRKDAEVTGDASASYGDLVDVAEVLKREGFTIRFLSADRVHSVRPVY